MLVGKKKGRAAFAKGRMSGSLPPLLAKVNGAVQVCCKWCGDVRGWYGEEEVYGESGVGMGCVGKRWGLEGGEGEGYMGGLVWRFGAQDLGVGHGKWVWPLELTIYSMGCTLFAGSWIQSSTKEGVSELCNAIWHASS